MGFDRFDVYRMPYEAVLIGIEPTPPCANVQIIPYALVTNDRASVDGDLTEQSTNFKAGGEVKWMTGPSSVLDFTFNTDFVQADVDRQVVNLTRFSVLFPERRQFFLEGNEIYRMAAWDELQPFFSRRIGLDDSGNPIPIDAGIRFTNRSDKQNIGLLAIRKYSPGITSYIYNYLDDLSFREGFISSTPFAVELQNSSEFSYRISTNWQSLRNTFSPVGIDILPGNYQFTSHRFSYFGDFSKNFAFSAGYRFGGYFDGKLNTISSSLRFAPLPHIQLTADYQFNQLSDLGAESKTVETHLIGTELRLALNPRIQLISFLQYNTATNRTTLNSRFVWEYQPLSYIYFVCNDNRQELFNDEIGRVTQFQDQQGIFKVTYLRQF